MISPTLFIMFFLDRVKSITTVTGTAANCDMDHDGIRIEITGKDHARCSTGILNGPGDDFEKGI